MPTTVGTTSGTIAGGFTHNRVDAALGAFTLYLPTAASCTGQEVVILKIDSSANAVTIAVASGSGDALNLPAGRNPLTTQWQVLRLRSTGVAWELAA